MGPLLGFLPGLDNSDGLPLVQLGGRLNVAMLRDSDIRTVTLQSWEMSIVKAMAAQWDYPGRSNIRQGDDRAGMLSTDALVGQVGTYAGVKFLYGASGLDKYLTGRWHANRRKFESDGGSDVDALNLDFKSSGRRDPGKTLLSYNLCVRPRERYDGWIYVLALVDQPTEDRAVVHLIGWASAEMLPSEPAKEGPLAGAFVLPARELHPLPPFEWLYFKTRCAA